MLVGCTTTSPSANIVLPPRLLPLTARRSKSRSQWAAFHRDNGGVADAACALLQCLWWVFPLLLGCTISAFGAGTTVGGDGNVTTVFITTDPWGVHVDAATGDILFTQRHSLHRIYANGTVVLVAGSATRGNRVGIGAAAGFDTPRGIAVSITHPIILYLVDHKNQCLRLVDLVTRTVTTFAGRCGIDYTGSTNGIGTAARFDHPHGIVLYHNKTTGIDVYLYVADARNCAIRRVEIATASVGTFAGAAGSCGAANGPRTTTARLNFPYDVTIDASGRWVYVADNYNCIRKIDATRGIDGMVTTLAGTCGTNGFEDGIGSAARFNLTYGITVNRDGSVVYVAERDNCAIRRVATTDGHVTTVAGLLGCVGGLEDGPFAAARFGRLYGIHYYVREGAAASGGVVEEGLVVTDNGNNAIRRVLLGTVAIATPSASRSVTGRGHSATPSPSHMYAGSASTSPSGLRPSSTMSMPTSPTQSVGVLTVSLTATSLTKASASSSPCTCHTLSTTETPSVSSPLPAQAWPALTVTTTAVTQATSAIVVLVSVITGCDVSNAVSLAMMSHLSCSGPIPASSSITYVVSVFYGLGFTAVAWGNIGVAVALSVAHWSVQRLVAALRCCDTSDDRLAWLRFPALSMVACEFLIPGAVLGAAASLVARESDDVVPGACAMVVVASAIAGVLLSMRHIVTAMFMVDYASSYLTGCEWEKTYLFPKRRWMPAAQRKRFEPLTDQMMQRWCWLRMGDVLLAACLALVTGLNVGGLSYACVLIPVVGGLYLVFATILVVVRPYRCPVDTLCCPLVHVLFGVLCMLKAAEADAASTTVYFVMFAVQFGKMLVSLWVGYREGQWG